MNICRRAAICVGQSAASGVLGWIALMAVFEAAYLAEAYLARQRRNRGAA